LPSLFKKQEIISRGFGELNTKSDDGFDIHCGYICKDIRSKDVIVELKIKGMIIFLGM
jgi:hypothetical protein